MGGGGEGGGGERGEEEEREERGRREETNRGQGERKGKRRGRERREIGRVTTINESKPKQRRNIPLLSSDDLSLQPLLENASTLSATEETHNMVS